LFDFCVCVLHLDLDDKHGLLWLSSGVVIDRLGRVIGYLLADKSGGPALHCGTQLMR
jgi:hypothetical protein